MEWLSRPTAGSLNALLVLEVAVRHSSLSRAARELGLSQPAVSRHVATLEGRLGQTLFRRNNNQIAPMPDAVRLAEAIRLGYGHIDQVWTDIAARSDRNEVTLACTYGFADQWLMPRFDNLRDILDGARVRIVTTDQLGDIDLSRMDAAVVWDSARLPDRPFFPLIRSEVFPICSPGFLRAHPDAAERIQDLPPEVFLHFDVGESGFMTWPKWFALAKIEPPRFTTSADFDAYPFLLQAVQRGEGIGLGWHGLVDKSLAKGDILRLGPSVSDRDFSYYLQHRPLQGDTGLLARTVQWFKDAAST
jgi:DNA-binding transcriptional LysR family regulator